MNVVILGIGSNMDPENNIRKMMAVLSEKMEVICISELVKTSPLGIMDQPDYINGAVKIQTNLSFDELNVFLKGVEDMLGRDRTAPKSGPRPMDLDIVVWNDQIVDQDYHTRDFLKKSVDEIR